MVVVVVVVKVMVSWVDYGHNAFYFWWGAGDCHGSAVLRNAINTPMATCVEIPYDLVKSGTGAVTQPRGAVTLPHSDFNQIIRYVGAQ